MAAVNEEVVRLLLDGVEAPIALDYEVHAGVLEIPAAFSMTIGHAGLTAELAHRFPPYTPFELRVGDTTVQVGDTDGLALAGSAGSAIRISGRDPTKWLVDTQIRAERTFAEKTFFQLTELALLEVGLDTSVIALDNIANRKAITGVQRIEELGPTTTTGAETDAGTAGGTAQQRTVYRTIKAEIGTTWWDFLAAQYRRAGLFLWSDVAGSFVLSRPKPTSPIYRIARRRTGQNGPGDVTVVGMPDWSHDTTKRYSECEVIGRAGGGKGGRGRVSARHFDADMVALLNADPADRADGGKRQKPLIIKDDKVRTKEQAAFLARRKVAESRRNGWKLSYTVAGHTAPSLRGGGRAIWQPDTCVEVIDDELGIEGPMYVESVVYRRTPETTTTVNLLRVEDLVFAEEDIENQRTQRVRGLAPRSGVTTVEHIRSETHEIWKRDPNWGGLPVKSSPKR